MTGLLERRRQSAGGFVALIGVVALLLSGCATAASPARIESVQVRWPIQEVLRMSAHD
jgi:hypothetical protein